MNAEHILDAMGLVDDDLIQEAERYSRPRGRMAHREWLGLAACFTVVVALVYGLAQLGMSGGNGYSGGMATEGWPASSAPNTPAGGTAGGNMAPPEEADGSLGDGDTCPLPEPDSSGQREEQPGWIPGGEGFCDAIMVGGILYCSTGEVVAVAVEESEIRTVVSYTNTLPEMDGQTNFSHDLAARYAMTDQGLVVEMEEQWVLFDPVTPSA